jgi:hypothetical protein
MHKYIYFNNIQYELNIYLTNVIIFRGSDTFRFLIDFDGHIGDPSTDKLLQDLKKVCR